MTSPIQDRMLVHLSTRLRPHDPELARIGDGVVLQGPGLSRSGADLARRSAGLLVFQHDGRPPTDEQLSLFSPDETWLQVQAKASVVTSRTVLFSNPRSMNAADAASAVNNANAFIDLAIRNGHRVVAASVAVDRRWLSRTDTRRTLVAALGDVRAPIHLMLSHSADPLGTDSSVTGLVELVQSRSDIAVLRCDHGALGAYAYGAMGGSIGATGGTRHFLMPGDGGGGVRDDPTPRVFLPVLLDWWRGSKLGLLDIPLLQCDTGTCAGRNLSRFQDEALLAEADSHSVISWMTLMDELKKAPAGSAREDCWTKFCQNAWNALDELEQGANLLHPASKQLKAWLRLVGARVY